MRFLPLACFSPREVTAKAAIKEGSLFLAIIWIRQERREASSRDDLYQHVKALLIIGDFVRFIHLRRVH